MASFSSVANVASSSDASFIERFRMTNIIYSHRAAVFRSSLRLSSHARRRAASLQLQVDTVKAYNCPQRFVSVKPLPFIDTTPSPSLPSCSPSSQVHEMQWIHETAESIQTMPKSVGEHSAFSDSDEDCELVEVHSAAESRAVIDITDITSLALEPAPSPIARPHRPALRCVIPSPPAQHSPESEWSSITLTSAVSASIGPQGHRIQDDCVLRNAHPGPGTIRLPAPRARYLSPLQVPREVQSRPLSWGCGEVEFNVSELESGHTNVGPSSASPSESCGSASYSSGSEDTTSGLNTPDDDQHHGASGLIIRIKRSSSSMDLEDHDIIDLTSGKDDIHVEKRPKFDRKDYVRSGHYCKNARPRSVHTHSRSDSLRSVSAPSVARA